MLDTNMISPKERPDFLNRLCKMCDQQRGLPKIMVIECLQDTSKIPEFGGGFADVFRGIYDEQPVAIKVMRLYVRSDRDLCLSVITHFISYALRRTSSDLVALRGSVEKPLCGDTCDTQMFCRCSA